MEQLMDDEKSSGGIPAYNPLHTISATKLPFFYDHAHPTTYVQLKVALFVHSLFTETVGNPSQYKHIIFGDSLSDSGLLAHRKLFGFIPFKWFTDTGEKGRFNTEFNWADYFKAMIEKKDPTNTFPDSNMTNEAVGGATAYNYTRHSDTIQEAVEGRVLLSNLNLQYKAYKKTMPEPTKEIPTQDNNFYIFAGSNDIITIIGASDDESRKAAPDKIIEGITNLLDKIQNSSKRIFLFTLPDFSHTPWAQNFARNQKDLKVKEGIIALVLFIGLIIAPIVHLCMPELTFIKWAQPGTITLSVLALLAFAVLLSTIASYHGADHAQKTLIGSLSDACSQTNDKIRTLASEHKDTITLVPIFKVFGAMIKAIHDHKDTMDIPSDISSQEQKATRAMNFDPKKFTTQELYKPWRSYLSTQKIELKKEQISMATQELSSMIDNASGSHTSSKI